MSDIYWAIKGAHGVYTGIYRTKVHAIAEHTNGFYRWHAQRPNPFQRSLTREQRDDWKKRRKMGDYAVRVRLVEVPVKHTDRGRE